MVKSPRGAEAPGCHCLTSIGYPNGVTNPVAAQTIRILAPRRSAAGVLGSQLGHRLAPVHSPPRAVGHGLPGARTSAPHDHLARRSARAEDHPGLGGVGMGGALRWTQHRRQSNISAVTSLFGISTGVPRCPTPPVPRKGTTDDEDATARQQKADFVEWITQLLSHPDPSPAIPFW
jgi:hypothetical protein